MIISMDSVLGCCCCCSVAQSCLTLQPHGLQHTRPPCPSPSPEVRPSLCSLFRWCHPAISSSDAFFSFCPQSFPASGTFQWSAVYINDRNTGVSAAASVLPMSIQGWFPLRLTGLSLLLSKGLSGVFSSTTVQRHQFLGWHGFKSQLFQLIAITVIPGNSVVKNPPANAGDVGLVPGSGMSPGGGNGNPLQYSCLENPTDRGAWRATVYRVTKSWTWLSMNMRNLTLMSLSQWYI